MMHVSNLGSGNPNLPSLSGHDEDQYADVVCMYMLFHSALSAYSLHTLSSAVFTVWYNLSRALNQLYHTKQSASQ